MENNLELIEKVDIHSKILRIQTRNFTITAIALLIISISTLILSVKINHINKSCQSNNNANNNKNSIQNAPTN